MQHWTRIPPSLNPVEAAALPMAVETAFRSLEPLGVGAEHTVLINGAGTTVGFRCRSDGTDGWFSGHRYRWGDLC